MKKVIIGLLVVLVLAGTTLGVCTFRLAGEVESLGEQLEVMRAEEADRVRTLSDTLDVYRQETSARLGLVGEDVQSNSSGVQENRDRLAAFEEAVKANAAALTELRAGISSLAAGLEKIGEESWLKADEVYQAVSQAVVQISNGQATIGSGFVYDYRGHILTAHHVAEVLTDIYVVFADGEVSSASLVGSSDLSDVAVLKLERDIGVAPLVMADSDAIVVGAPAVTVGSPFDLGGTVTAGIISQTDRFEGIGEGEDIRWIANLVQFDAPANFGNSGGPLLDADGLVAGLIIARVGPASGEGVSYAVSANKVRRVADAIIERGVFDYPWLGVEAGDLTPAAVGALGRDNLHGVLVGTVVPGGPAWLAGMQAGDIIIAMNESPITSMADLTSYLGEHASPGDLVTVEIDRVGVLQELEVTIGVR